MSNQPSGGGAASETPDWFQDSTPEVLDKEKQRRSEEYARRNQRRVWIQVGKEWEGVFIDDSPRSFHEHNLYLNGTRKNNNFTCIARLDRRDVPALKDFWGGCPLCNELNDEPYMAGLVTVLNITPFVGNDGKTISKFRQILTLKLSGLEWLNTEKRIRKSLIGAKYFFSRKDKKKDPVYGSPSFIEKVDLNAREFKYETKDHKILSPDAFDYKKVTAPLTRQRLMQIVEQMQRQKAQAERRQASQGQGRGGGGGGGGNGWGQHDPADDGGTPEYRGAPADDVGTGDDEIPF